MNGAVSRWQAMGAAFGACLVAASAQVAHAWEGHDFDQWKKVTAWTMPDIKTDQAGRKDLAPLLVNRGETPASIDEIRGWEAKRAGIRKAVLRILGEPSDLRPPPPEVQLLGEKTLDDHVRRHIRIRTEPDDWIPAYVLVPKNMREARVPAMICLHQTVAQGKEEPCGMRGNGELAFALQLVRRGYVCIAPDAIGFGERIPEGAQPYHGSIAFYRRHPGWSFMGKMIWDVSRVIDYLETLPCVDPLCIGSIGHSHGAYGTLFAAAFEPRISLAIASCGFTTLRSDPRPERWSHLTALIPQLGLYLPDVKTIPFDWHEICAMIAPRPLFVWYATRDTIFPNTANLDALFRDVRNVYGLYGAADDLAWRAFDGEHQFPDAGREEAYRWLEERFFFHGDIRVVPKDRETWEKQRQVIRRLVRRTLGTPPTQPPPPNVRTLETVQCPSFERRLIEYDVDADERVKAYLCLPRRGGGRLPAVLVLHQTVAEGKKESVGLAGNASFAFGADLAARGYVTLSPDSIAAGERVDRYGAFDTRGHYLRHPTLSAMGRMLCDAQRAVDVLSEAEGVERDGIGVVGHSLGAETAVMLAAFDERICATIASCGFATFAAEKDRLRWARDHWFSYMPKLRPVFELGRLPAWDWDDCIRLIAPRALFMHNTLQDDIFHESRSAFDGTEAARPVWLLLGHPERLANTIRPGKHEMSNTAKAEAYDWLDRQMRVPASATGTTNR